jgi:hypothetical protein
MVHKPLSPTTGTPRATMSVGTLDRETPSIPATHAWVTFVVEPLEVVVAARRVLLPVHADASKRQPRSMYRTPFTRTACPR